MEDRSLFGETGSGNSSVVNLLAGKEVSRTSPGIDGCTEALASCNLVRDLTKAGGVDLLLFCHRQGRITTITRRNYAPFYEVVCRQPVPIAVVITHLEQEERIEDWWDQMQRSLSGAVSSFVGMTA